MALGFWMNNKNCYGCKTCSIACKSEKQLDQGVLLRHVTEIKQDDPRALSFLSLSCNHCDDPACTKVCPTGAMHKDAETGLVSVDADKCVGCGYCHMACPYNAPKVDRSKGHSVKCDGCAERVAAGEKPVCVEACPARALDFGTVEEMSKVGERGNIAPLPEPHYTNPNLFIKPSADAKPAGSADGKVVNPLEVM